MADRNLLAYLKSPELVAEVQHYFGVRKSQTNGEKNLEKNTSEYVILNKFWYYLFHFGTALGDEVFYTIFIPFWFWNIDGAVGRRVVLVWAIVMYIGQGIKDIVRWSRPGKPVIRLHDKWALEYGMPSTHAMVGISIPFSILLYTIDRYQYNVPVGVFYAVIWCTLICISRLYLGMHTVLDVVVGLALAIGLMFPLVPIIDSLDNYFLTSPTGPFLLLVSSILMIIYYPNSGKWTPTRGDTTMILSVCVGVHLGSWLNYQTGEMTPRVLEPPYAIMWPSYWMLGCLLLRTVIGFTFLLIAEVYSKKVSYNLFCALLKEDAVNLKKTENTLQNKHKTIVELGCKYVTYALVGFNILYVIPQLFKLLRIERPTFFTEF